MLKNKKLLILLIMFMSAFFEKGDAKYEKLFFDHTIKNINNETIDLKAGYGANLRKAALYNDAEVYKGFNKFLNCRGHGLCGKCVVEIEPIENVNPRTFFENLHKLEDHQKLGCRVKVYGDITVKAAIQD